MQTQIARILSTDISKQLVSHLESNEEEIDKLEQLLGQKNEQVYELHRLINEELNRTIQENGELMHVVKSMGVGLGALRGDLAGLRDHIASEKGRMARFVAEVGNLITQKMSMHEDNISKPVKTKTKEVSIQTDAEPGINTTNHLLQRLQKLQQTILTLKQQKWALQKQVKKCQAMCLSPSPQKSDNSIHSLTPTQKQSLLLSALSTDFSRLSERKYCGQTIENRKHGHGICEYEGDFVYEGNFVRGMRCGLGEIRFGGHVVYRGCWKEGVFGGKGCLYRVGVQGVDRYWGNFRAGKIEGYGTMFYETGEKVRGFFSDGKLVGSALIENPNNNTLELTEMPVCCGNESKLTSQYCSIQEIY